MGLDRVLRRKPLPTNLTLTSHRLHDIVLALPVRLQGHVLPEPLPANLALIRGLHRVLPPVCEKRVPPRKRPLTKLADVGPHLHVGGLDVLFQPIGEQKFPTAGLADVAAAVVFALPVGAEAVAVLERDLALLAFVLLFAVLVENVAAELLHAVVGLAALLAHLGAAVVVPHVVGEVREGDVFMTRGALAPEVAGFVVSQLVFIGELAVAEVANESLELWWLKGEI